MSEWLSDYVPLTPHMDWSGTDDAVRHLGTNALPALLDRAAAEDSPFELDVLALLRHQHLVPITHRDPQFSNAEAYLGFRALGSAGAPAVPGLMAIYRSHGSARVRNTVVVCLADIGPAAKDAVPLIIEATTNIDFLLGGNAVYALGEIHGHPELSVPALIKVLNQPQFGHWDRRAMAARSLQQFGPDARAAAPDLIRALSDSDGSLRRAATNALEAIEPDAVPRAAVR